MTDAREQILAAIGNSAKPYSALLRDTGLAPSRLDAYLGTLRASGRVHLTAQGWATGSGAAPQGPLVNRKECPNCLRWLPSSVFHRNAANDDGLERICGSCRNAKLRAKRAARKGD